jgi:hypothetical protein
MAAQMKALRFAQYGPPARLHIESIARPEPEAVNRSSKSTQRRSIRATSRMSPVCSTALYRAPRDATMPE